MSRVPKHFGLNYNEELNMLKELEKVRKETKKEFLKFKQVLDSKPKKSPHPFSPLSRDLNNYSLRSSKSPYEVLSTDKIVPPEPSAPALQDSKTQSQDPRKKIPGSEVPLKESKKTSLADKTGSRPFCPKEFYLKNNPYIYQQGRGKPVIASLAGTSKPAVLFKQPSPPRKPRRPRIILRQRPSVPQFPLPLKSDRKRKASAATDPYHTEDYVYSHPMPRGGQAGGKTSRKKKRQSKRRKEVARRSYLAGKKRKKPQPPSFVEERISTVELPEEAEVVPTVEEELVQEESEEDFASLYMPLRVVPRSIEEIIASLQSERQSAADKMIKDLIESILGRNYDIKMEDVSFLTNYKFQQDTTQTQLEVKESDEELPMLYIDERLSEDELKILEIEDEFYDDLESSDIKQSTGELTSALDTSILSQLPTQLDVSLSKTRRVPGAFQVSSIESLQITGKTAITSPRTNPKIQTRRLHADASQISKTSSKTSPSQQLSTYTLHKLCTSSPDCMLPTDLQLASRIYHTIDKAGHNTFIRSDRRDSSDDSIRNEKEKARILYGIPTSESKDKRESSSSETSGTPVKWKKPDEKPSFQIFGEEISIYPGSVKMFWTPAPPKFSAPVSLMRQMLYPKYESSCTFKFLVESQESQDSLHLVDVEKKSKMPKLRLKRSKSLSYLQKPIQIKPKKSLKRSLSVFDFTGRSDSIAAMIPDDIQSNLRELTSQKEYFLKIINEKKEVSEENLDVLASTNAQKMSIQDTPTDQNATSPLETSRRAEIQYIVLPRRKRRKLRKGLDPEKFTSVLKELSKPPKSLKRSQSLVILREQKKFFLHVPIYVRRSRCPSLPSVLNFDQFVQKQGGIPQNSNPQQWIWDFWMNNFQQPFFTQESEKVEEVIETPVVKSVEPTECRRLLKIELDDFSNPDLSEHVRICLETEVENLTKEIKAKKTIPALLYCRRGAIYRKLGKLKKAMNDLQEAIFLEPLLLNAYWHRHFIYIFQDKIGDALDDLNYITKYNKNNADVFLSKAELYRRKGDFTLTLLNYTQAIKCRPTDDELYFRRAELLDKGNKLLALDDYSKCIYYNPKRIDALLKRGLHHFETSNWFAAIQDFSSLLTFDFKNIQARTYRGRAFFKKGHFREATEDLTIAIHLDPNNWIAFYYRACIMRKTNQNRSLQDFSVSVLINDDLENLPAFLHRGILYTEMRRWLLAVADFESVLALNRNTSFAFINIGLIYLLHMDKYFEAIQQFTEAIQVNPLCLQSYLCRAQTYYKIHKLPQAVKDLSRAIHLQPDKIQLYIMRGQYLLDMKQYDLAKATIFQVAQLNKGSVELSPVQRSLIFTFCENHHEAIKILLSVTLCRPEAPMFTLLGKAQMKAKKIKNAMSSFKKALDILAFTDKITKGSFLPAECFYNLGLCYMEEDNFQLAYDSFSRAVKVYPEYSDAFYQRGLCRVKLQKDNCVQDFNRAVTINPKHYQAYISRAAYYGMRGRFSKAILNCNEAIRIFPNSVRAFLYRGVLKYHNKTYKLAITDLTIAISMNRNCHLAFYNRAICYSKIKEFHMALKDYGIVLLLNVGEDIKSKTLINRGLIYTELKITASALEDFREATQINKDDANLFQAAGICHHRMGEYEEAVHSFTHVIELNSFFLDAYVGRGNSYMEYGHEAANKQAQKDFIRALHYNPMYLKARISLGYDLQAQGKFQKAWNHFTISVDIDPGCYKAFEGRGIVCLQMGDNFAAMQDINAALKITTTAEFLTNRGVIHEFMGERHIAMKDYQAALSINPEYSLAYFNAGNIYLHHRQFSQANEFYSKALQFDPLNDSAILNRAITNIILQKFEEAKEDFKKATNLCPFWASVYYNKAYLHFTLKQYEVAEEDLSKALSIVPNDYMAYKLRADVRGKMGLIEEALKDYNQSLDLQEFSKVV